MFLVLKPVINIRYNVIKTFRIQNLPRRQNRYHLFVEWESVCNNYLVGSEELPDSVFDECRIISLSAISKSTIAMAVTKALYSDPGYMSVRSLTILFSISDFSISICRFRIQQN